MLADDRLSTIWTLKFYQFFEDFRFSQYEGLLAS
jgi:hypothetical protein